MRRPSKLGTKNVTDLDRLRTEYADRAVRMVGSDIYSLFNPAYLFEYQRRQRHVLRLLRKHNLYPLADKRVLEVGCGRGGVLLEWMSYGTVHLHGVDLLPDRLDDARTRLPRVPLICADGQRLPYPNRSFDIVLQYTAFSSVLDDAVKANLAREMLRVLKPDGVIVWYDFWLNPTNPHTKGIRPDEIRRLFAGCQCEFQRVTLAPPITRRFVGLSWLLCAALEKLSVFNTHYLAVMRHE